MNKLENIDAILQLMNIYHLYFIFFQSCIRNMETSSWMYICCVFLAPYILSQPFSLKKHLLLLLVLYSAFLIGFLRGVVLFKVRCLNKFVRPEVCSRRHVIDAKHDYLKNEKEHYVYITIQLLDLLCCIFCFASYALGTCAYPFKFYF